MGRRKLAAFWLAVLSPLACSAADSPPPQLAPVNHIIVIFLENHSFDNLFGTFPGADGFASVKNLPTQTDSEGKPYDVLPPVLNGGKPDARFPKNLPNRPFLISRYVPDSEKTGDLQHRFYQLQEQLHGGRMDRFVASGNSGGLPMGYYDDRHSPLWEYARQYTLADHFFTAAFGGSFLNHMWLVCACTPRYENAPQALRAELGADGKLLKDAPLTPDGFAVNTIEPFTPPYNRKSADAAMRLPLQTLATIGERLEEKHIGWAWYSGGWRDADAGNPPPTFFPHHQPFPYFARYAAGSEGRKKHLKDEADFIAAIDDGTLPPVSFYKPIGEFDLHPGYADMASGQTHVFTLIRRIEKSALWKDSLIIVTFDEAGGFYDHAAPPSGDRFGPGERIPTLIISPFAKKGYIDHTVYDTTSILKLIESRFGLSPLTDRDAKANNMLNALMP